MSIFPKRYSCLGKMGSNAPNAMIATLKPPPKPLNTLIAKGRNTGQTPNAIIAKGKQV